MQDVKMFIERDYYKPGAIAVNSYYPLFTTESASNACQGGDGSSHSHQLNGITYYMPNGLTMGTNQFHGDFPAISYSNLNMSALFSEAQSAGAIMPNGKFVEPHNLSEFYNAEIGASAASIKITSIEETSTDIQVSSNPLMYHEYKNNWGPDGYNDGALIDVNNNNKDFDYFIFRLKKGDGTLIRNWDNISRFRIKRNHYYNPTVGGITYNAYFLTYTYSSYSYSQGSGYYYVQPVTKGGKLLYHFVEDGASENMSTANSAIADSGATNGDKIWDTVRDIHANPASYRIAKSQTDLTTDPSVSTHPQNRIISDYETFGLNKYFFSLGYSSGGSWSSTPLDFSGATVGDSFGTGSGPNSATTTEQGGTWTYTVPSGVTQIEISGVGGGGGSWGAHDGGYSQSTRPGGIGS